MKTIVSLLSVIAATLVLASCASKATTADQSSANMPAQTSGASHHDYKGEMK